MVERKLTQIEIQSTGVRAFSPFLKKLYQFQNSKIFFRFISVLQQLMVVSWKKEIEKEKETQRRGKQWVKISKRKVQFSSTQSEEELGLQVLKALPCFPSWWETRCGCGHFQWGRKCPFARCTLTSSRAHLWSSLEQDQASELQAMWANTHPRPTAFSSCPNSMCLTQNPPTPPNLIPRFCYLFPLSIQSQNCSFICYFRSQWPIFHTLSSSFTSLKPCWPQGPAESRQKWPLFSLFFLNISVYGTHWAHFKNLFTT